MRMVSLSSPVVTIIGIVLSVVVLCFCVVLDEEPEPWLLLFFVPPYVCWLIWLSVLMTEKEKTEDTTTHITGDGFSHLTTIRHSFSSTDEPAIWIVATIIMFVLSFFVLGVFSSTEYEGEFPAVLFYCPWISCLYIFTTRVWGGLGLIVLSGIVWISWVAFQTEGSEDQLDQLNFRTLSVFVPLCGSWFISLGLSLYWFSHSKIYQFFSPIIRKIYRFCSSNLLGLIDILIMIIYIRFSWELIEPLFY